MKIGSCRKLHVFALALAAGLLGSARAAGAAEMGFNFTGSLANCTATQGFCGDFMAGMLTAEVPQAGIAGSGNHLYQATIMVTLHDGSEWTGDTFLASTGESDDRVVARLSDGATARVLTLRWLYVAMTLVLDDIGAILQALQGNSDFISSASSMSLCGDSGCTGNLSFLTPKVVSAPEPATALLLACALLLGAGSRRNQLGPTPRSTSRPM